MSHHRVLNTPAIRRMPTYYHRLVTLQALGEEYVSTSKLAKYIGMDAIVVRKDLELTGVIGGRGIGYRISELLASIRTYLGWDKWIRACLVGCGALGTALLGFHDFTEYGLNICEVFDNSPAKIGQEVYGRLVRDVQEMPAILQSAHIELAVLCVPVSVAQSTATTLAENGIKMIWNFTNTCLDLPTDVIVQREVIAGGFALLSRKRKEHVKSSELE